MNIVVVREPWRLDPLAWIHRAEAGAIARELKAPLVTYTPDIRPECALLRFSDPFMRGVLGGLQFPYRGPGCEALERCYDKFKAHRSVSAAGFDSPETALGNSSVLPAGPYVVKPRRGSDSLGVRTVAVIPEGQRNIDHLVQARVIGREVTIALYRGEIGLPLEIRVPRGQPYSFLRKYVVRPRREAFEDSALRTLAQRIGQVLEIDWAARVDFIVEADTGRAWFLECDAAPLVGAGSAFAESFAAAGVDRRRQLDWLLAP